MTASCKAALEGAKSIRSLFPYIIFLEMVSKMKTEVSFMKSFPSSG